jgi:hypothetical protein
VCSQAGVPISSKTPKREILASANGCADHPRPRCHLQSIDALLAQSAVDRLTSGAHALILDGPSDRQRDAHNRRATLEPESEIRNAH